MRVSAPLQACTTLDIDIISMDLSLRLAFKLRPAMLQSALARGVVFEVMCLQVH